MTFKFINRILLWSVGLSHQALDDNKKNIDQAIRSSERFTKEGWAKYFAALRIAVEAGVLKRCDQHDGIYFPGNEGIEKAYKLGNAKFTANELKGTFESSQEMTDLIKFVINDHPGSRFEGRCEICASTGRYGNWGG